MIRRLILPLVAVFVVALAAARLARPARPPAALGAMGHGPEIVLVHGLGSSAESWLPLARDLARDHRVVLVELPGHGLADMPPRLTLESAALALDRALDEQTQGPALVVGHSVGGLVATAEALRAPERVRGLVLVETSLRPQLTPGERAALLSRLDRDWDGTLYQVYASFGRDSAQGAWLARQAVAMGRPRLEPWIRLALAADLSRAVAALEPPALAVLAPRSWESGERWSAVAESLGYARAPRLTGVRIEGCGHFVMLDRPRALAAEIRRFERASALPAVALR